MKISKEIAWVITGNVLATLGTLIGFKILTGYLSPAQYGELILCLTIVTLLNQLCFGPLAVGGLRFYNLAETKNNKTQFLNAFFKLNYKGIFIFFSITILLGVVLLILKQQGLAIFSFAAVLFAIISGLNGMFDSIQNASRQRSIVALHQVMSAWGKNLLAVLVIIFFGKSSLSAISGYIVACVLVLLSQQFFFNQKNGKAAKPVIKESEDWNKKILRYSLPYAGWGIFTWLSLSSDRWALKLFSSPQDVGLYGALYQLGFYPAFLLSNVIMQVLVPIMFGKAGDGTNKENMLYIHRSINKVLLLFGTLTLVMTFGVYLLHNWLFNLFIDKQYHSVSALLPLMVLSGGLFNLGQICTLTLMSENDSSRMIQPKIGSAIISIILYMAGAYYWGVEGVVFASLGYCFIYFAWIFILVKNQRPVTEAEKNISSIPAPLESRSGTMQQLIPRNN